MIVAAPDDGPVELVAQSEHARHAGALAERVPDLPDPRGPFEDATAVHDDGWRGYDQEPGWNPETGLPHTYRTIPTEPYVEVWRRGIAEARERAPYVGLLVSLHGSAFLSSRDHPEARAFVEDQRETQDRFLREEGWGGSWDDLPEPVATHREWMSFLDALSLFLLDRWESPWTATVAGRDREARRGGLRGTVEPWPFEADRLQDTVPVVLLGEGPFETRESMAAALARAPRGSRAVELVAPERFGDPSGQG